jgi:CheY-like chemotaxis protein
MADRKRILILDGSPAALAVAREALEARGHQVATAGDILEFQELLDAFRPELVLTDLELPDLPGHELVRVLKQDAATERIPVVIFSARPDAELALLAERVGADGHLGKGQGGERLGEMVDDLIDSILW